MNWAAIASLFVGVVIAIVGFVLGWYVFPGIVEDEIAENVKLINGTDQYKRFEELPIPLDFKVYIFNIENPVDVNAGHKPVVKEKGPYIYKQSRNKTGIQWSSNKRISYYEYQYFDFDQDASGDLKETDYVTVLNPALNGAIQILEITKLPYVLPMLNRNVEQIFGVDDNIFLTIKVGDFLFNGYDICDFEKINGLTDETAKAETRLVCLGLLVMPTKNIAPKMNVADKADFGKMVFTFLGHKKDKHDGKYTVNSGLNHVDETGWIERWEDKEYLSNWRGNDSHCNKVRGRDAVIYEPSLTEKSTLTVFNTDICRTVDLRYTNDVEFRDVTALEYRLGEDMFQAPKDDDMCYCLNITKGAIEDTGCVKNGMVELFTCYNAPILLSYPHFMWADKEYKESVDGLKVEIDKHKTFAVIEPNTGTPLKGAKRVQFNMYVNGQKDIPFLENYKNTPRLIPIVWLEEGFTINDKLYQDLYDLYISKTYLITGVTWGVIGVGLAVIVITTIVAIVLNKRKAKQTV